jgi:hypothetical protein
MFSSTSMIALSSLNVDAQLVLLLAPWMGLTNVQHYCWRCCAGAKANESSKIYSRVIPDWFEWPRPGSETTNSRRVRKSMIDLTLGDWNDVLVLHW